VPRKAENNDLIFKTAYEEGFEELSITSLTSIEKGNQQIKI